MSEIRQCLPPDRYPRRPRVALPKGSIDTHVHVFAPGYRLSPARGYTPPYSTLAELQHLHSMLGIERVVFTQPSVYGTDNSPILDAMAALNRETPGRARCVVALDMNVTEDELAALDAAGVRGVRLNTDNKGGMPIRLIDIPEHSLEELIMLLLAHSQPRLCHQLAERQRRRQSICFSQQVRLDLLLHDLLRHVVSGEVMAQLHHQPSTLFLVASDHESQQRRLPHVHAE